jgi:hypothetical protein
VRFSSVFAESTLTVVTVVSRRILRCPVAIWVADGGSEMPSLEEGLDWTCPYCGAHQALVEKRYHQGFDPIINNESEFGPIGVLHTSMVCANSKCKKMTLDVQLRSRKIGPGSGSNIGGMVRRWSLLPESSAKPLPDYIPNVIRTDYIEACRIRDLSPKASATLARRCLQGMIRDFCGITKKRLIEEINELRSQIAAGRSPKGVQPDTIDAIDHVRSIGNIGAHMEADINVIIDVDPDESQTLIGLLELLFEEWYVARSVRAERLKAIGIVASEKMAAKLVPSAGADSAPGKKER